MNYSPQNQKDYKTTSVRKREQKKSKLSYFVFLFIAILLVIIIYQLIDLRNFKLATAVHGEVIDGFKSKALVIREEKVFRAPYKGIVEVLKEENQRINSGEKVAIIKNQSNQYPIYNHRAGIISYATDGLEKILNEQSLADISVQNLNNYERSYQHLINNNRVQKGEPVYRIVNNYQLYLAVPTTSQEAEEYRLGEIIFINDGKDDDLIEGEIIRIDNNIEQSLIIVKLERYIPRWTNLRWVDVRFIKNIYRGIRIPRKAIFTKPDGQGVLLLRNSGSYFFREIIIVDGNDNHAIVEGLDVGDNVITNPEDFNFGRKG